MKYGKYIDRINSLWYNKTNGGENMKNTKKETISVNFSTYDALKSTRGTWGIVNPRTRVVESKKVYKRHKKHRNKVEE